MAFDIKFLLILLFWLGPADSVHQKTLFHLGKLFNLQSRSQLDAPANPHVAIKYFDQRLDHFTPDQKTWKQKFWVNSEYYRPGGPVFILIGGEGPTSQHWMTEGAARNEAWISDEGTSDWLKNAKLFNALAIQFEHRFYGDSYPTPNMSTLNLRYLNSKQALADLARFIGAMKRNQTDLPYNFESAKFITFGGSYSGALSAWFRDKYPHLVVGAIASSAPVYAKYNFKEYLEVVKESLKSYSPTCIQSINAATLAVHAALRQGKLKELKSRLHLCEDIDTKNQKDISNLFENLMGNFAGAVQYNLDNRGVYAEKWTIKKLCDIMDDESKGQELDRYGAVADYVGSLSNQTCMSFQYSKMMDDLKNSENSPDRAGRLWTYQTCTEFGYFQSTDAVDHPFGKEVPVEFFTDMCTELFGEIFNETTVKEYVAETNTYYGGRDLLETNIVLPNGSLDPWHALSITKSSDPRRPAIYINGTAHCANMYPPRESNNVNLQKARQIITQYIASWHSQS